MLAQRFFDGIAEQFAEHTDITAHCRILFVHITPDPVLYDFYLVNKFHASGADRLPDPTAFLSSRPIDTIFSKKTSKSAHFLKFNYGTSVISTAYFAVYYLFGVRGKHKAFPLLNVGFIAGKNE
jgi:hypothetical protein